MYRNRPLTRIKIEHLPNPSAFKKLIHNLLSNWLNISCILTINLPHYAAKLSKKLPAELIEKPSFFFHQHLPCNQIVEYKTTY